MRVRGGELGDPAHGGGPDAGTGREPVEGEPLRVDQGVADVVAFQERREDGSGGQRAVGRHVLDAVHGEVGLTGQDRGVDLLRERALALDL